MEQNKQSLFLPYLGALVGALIGAIPFGVGVWYGWFVGPFAAICAYASYFAFKKLGGEPQQETKILIPVISLIAILLTNVAIVMLIAVEAGATFSQVLNFEPIREYLVETFMMSILFGVLGIYYIYRQIAADTY